MANIYKSNYTGSQVDSAIGRVVNGELQDKLSAGANITITNNTISATVPTIPSITITNGSATTPTTDTVSVISGETASGHTITNTKVNVATKAYVDKKSVAAVQYLGTVSNATELAALAPDSVGDFCRVATAFSSYHAGDLLLCKTLKTSSAAATWDVIHGEIDKDTWTANSKSAAGYVTAGGSNANKVWKTDASGNPAWRDDADTDTKVTSAANHYAPSADSASQLSANASSTTAATWNSTSMVTGVNVQRDAKGHVTGVTVNSIKMPANPNTDTNTSHSHSYGVGIVGSGSAGTGGGTYTYKAALADETLDTNAAVSRPAANANRTYPVIADKNGKLAAIVPWTDSNTTYSAGTGISITNNTINHKNSVTAGTAQGSDTKTLIFGGTFTIPTITYDAQGHITGKGTTTMTMPANPNTDTHYVAHMYVGAKDALSNAATSNDSTYLKLGENSTLRDQFKIIGSGATAVSSDASGNITISSTNTTYAPGTHITISSGTISAAWPTASDTGYAGINKTGTITGITMNGASKGTSGTVDLGDVLTPSYITINPKPTGGGSIDIATLGLGDTVYNISSVKANPDSTNIKGELTKIYINGYNYSLPSGGGSGDVTAAGNNTFTGYNTFKGTSNFNGIINAHNINVNAESCIQMEKLDSQDEICTTFLYANAVLADANIYLPSKSGTLALLSDITVSASGNNTFTGMNTFNSSIAAKQGFIAANGSTLTDNAGYKYNCITRYTNNTTYTLSIPSKTGTLALTNDIKIKSASLSGTTLTLTI